MEKFAIFNQMRPGNIKGLRSALLSSGAHSGQSKSGDQIATLHNDLLGPDGPPHHRIGS
jgi:hypothetical protein